MALVGGAREGAGRVEQTDKERKTIAETKASLLEAPGLRATQGDRQARALDEFSDRTREQDA